METTNERGHEMREIYRDGEYLVEYGNGELKVTNGEKSKLGSFGAFTKIMKVPATFVLPEVVDRNDYLYISGTFLLIRKESKEQVEQLLADICGKADAVREEKERILVELIPGLRELEKAYAAREKYHEEFEKMMEDEDNDGVNPPRTEVLDIQVLERRFPRAAVYLRCEQRSMSSWKSPQSAIYQKAVTKIEAGGDPAEAEKEAEEQWAETAREAVERS